MKIGNLFDSVAGNFFRILTGKNKAFYADCLLELYEQYNLTNTSDFDRNHVYMIISACMEAYRDKLDDEDIDEDEQDSPELGGQTIIQKSCPLTKEMVFARIKRCGWIETDIDESHNQLISFTMPASTFLPTLKKMTQPSRISLGGYTRNIIENLEAVFKVKHPYQDAFLLALENTNHFMHEMSKIGIVIKQEIQSVLDCDDFSTMTSMLNDYLDNYLNGDYYKLQFEENLTAGERQRITDLLIAIESNADLYKKLIAGVKDYMSIDDDDEAELYITRAMETIQSRLCDDYESKSRYIMHTQSQYISSANIKISMLMTDKKNASGTINRIVMAIESLSEDEFRTSKEDWLQTLTNALTLPLGLYLTEESLYKPRSQPKELSDDIEIIKPREKEPVSLHDFYGYLSKYNTENVDRKIKTLIGARQSLPAAELPLETTDDYHELVSMALFGSERQSKYNVLIKKGNRIKKNGFDCVDFTISRKEPERG